MPAGSVSRLGAWPEPETTFPLELLDDEGATARMFKRGPGEIDITAGKDEEGRTLLVPVEFPTLAQAERAAEILDGAFAAVRAIFAETPPQPDDGHVHDTVVQNFARELSKWGVCKLCGQTLREVTWAEQEAERVKQEVA